MARYKPRVRESMLLLEPRVSPIIAARQDGLPEAVTQIAWKAQTRLYSKFKRLSARRVKKTNAVVAVARELAGFVWTSGARCSSRAGRASSRKRREGVAPTSRITKEVTHQHLDSQRTAGPGNPDKVTALVA